MNFLKSRVYCTTTYVISYCKIGSSVLVMIGKDAMRSKSYLKLENNTVMKKCSILEEKAVRPLILKKCCWDTFLNWMSTENYTQKKPNLEGNTLRFYGDLNQSLFETVHWLFFCKYVHSFGPLTQLRLLLWIVK